MARPASLTERPPRCWATSNPSHVAYSLDGLAALREDGSRAEFVHLPNDATEADRIRRLFTRRARTRGWAVVSAQCPVCRNLEPLKTE